MSLSVFRALSPIAQLYWVLQHATYLAQYEGEEGGIRLYHCPSGGRGFFAEVGVNDGKGFAVMRRSFTDTDPLEKYSCEVLLPQEWV